MIISRFRTAKIVVVANLNKQMGNNIDWYVIYSGPFILSSWFPFAETSVSLSLSHDLDQLCAEMSTNDKWFDPNHLPENWHLQQLQSIVVCTKVACDLRHVHLCDYDNDKRDATGQNWVETN